MVGPNQSQFMHSTMNKTFIPEESDMSLKMSKLSIRDIDEEDKKSEDSDQNDDFPELQ